VKRMQSMRPLDAEAMRRAQARWDGVAKPLGSLGKLEKLIVHIAGIQETAQVDVKKRCALVFCADNGVLEEGVAQSGYEVTALVAHAIAQGEGNVNLMALAAGAQAFAVDVGMRQDVSHPALIERNRPQRARNAIICFREDADAQQIAEAAGLKGLGNIVMVGKLFEKTGFCERETLDAAIDHCVPPKRAAMIEMNKKALELGMNA